MRPTFLAAAAGPTARLPTGIDVRCVSRRDVLFLYGEIYQRRCYMQHGIKLQPGGTVIDCGANIGLFSMLAAEELGPEVRQLQLCLVGVLLIAPRNLGAILRLLKYP